MEARGRGDARTSPRARRHRGAPRRPGVATQPPAPAAAAARALARIRRRRPPAAAPATCPCRQ
eukprot:350255-Chlamydomonas_euryale.AAC.22